MYLHVILCKPHLNAKQSRVVLHTDHRDQAGKKGVNSDLGFAIRELGFGLRVYKFRPRSFGAGFWLGFCFSAAGLSRDY